MNIVRLNCNYKSHTDGVGVFRIDRAYGGIRTSVGTDGILNLASGGAEAMEIVSLTYDTNQTMSDQMEAVEQSSQQRGDEHVNLALLTDGLKAEREQGITIDVAYRYFATPKRKFIIADTPGHIQYTRNMVTGASTANLAIILVDARKGVIEQTCRHSFIASLLRIQHIVVCVNKMDLVDYSQGRNFNNIFSPNKINALKKVIITNNN